MHHNVRTRMVFAVSLARWATGARGLGSRERISKRAISSLIYQEHGHPSQVLRLTNDGQVLPSPGPGEVLIKFLACPMNPADFNMIEGNYGLLPPLPAIGGNEGVAIVERVGEGVMDLQKGDWVIPSQAGFGTWRDAALAPAGSLTQVPNDIPLDFAACIAVNPCTAYRLLSDFVTLRSGEVIVQNGATSSVGQAVLQLCQRRGIKTINIVRDSTFSDERENWLRRLGATEIVTDKMLKDKNLVKAILKRVGIPKLGLNCVGGETGTGTAALLGEGGTLVTYGGMSKEPVKVPTGFFIFKDITFKGYWMTRWVKRHSKEERQEMIRALGEMAKKGELSVEVERFPIEDYSKVP